jgi:predicted transcriptional regulator
MWYRSRMEKTTLYLTEELQAGLRDLARRTGRPQAALIREAVASYVSAAERPRPRSIGIARSGAVPASEAKRWVHAAWDREYAERRWGERPK